MKITIDEFWRLKLAKIEATRQKLLARKARIGGMRSTDGDALVLAATQLEYFLSDLFREEEMILQAIGGGERHVGLHRDLLLALRGIRWSYVEARNQGLAQDARQLTSFIESYLSDHCQTADAASFGDMMKAEVPAPLPIAAAPPSRGTGFTDFHGLCQAAVTHRVRSVLSFFQQGQPTESASLLPPLFFASPSFTGALETAIDQVIYPKMRESGSLRRLSEGVSIQGLDEETFWQFIPATLSKAITAAWAQAWDHLRPVAGRNDGGVTVMRVRKELKDLREILGFRQERTYDLPACGNRELELMKSFFDPRTDWADQLKECWTILTALYDLEFIKGEAREGVLRDTLLTKIDQLPPGWGDPLLFTCYRAMPFITTIYIETFSTNLGRSEAQREAWLPYVTYYMRKARGSRVIRDKEILEIRKLREENVALRLSPAADEVSGAIA